MLGNPALKIKPVREWDRKLLPSAALKSDLGIWKALYGPLEDAMGVAVVALDKRTATFIDRSYDKTTEVLKKKCSYAFIDKPGQKPASDLAVSTWQKRTSRKRILAVGTANDIAALPPAKQQNNKRKKKNVAAVAVPAAPAAPDAALVAAAALGALGGLGGLAVAAAAAAPAAPVDMDVVE